MGDQKNPGQVYALVVFESEDKARASRNCAAGPLSIGVVNAR